MMGESAGRVVLIAGPTASGKSALALSMAQSLDGVIVNTDAMQIYDTLCIVTARPSTDEVAQVPHRLYGTVPATTRYSTGRWLEAVRGVMEADAGRPLIFVGGTGLYFDALTNGFAEIPEIPAAVALEVQQEIQALDADGRRKMLEAVDPVAASRLKVVDPQRLIRALAVQRVTGRTLSSFQDTPQAGLLDEISVERMVLEVDRDVLRDRIARRFEKMFESGAVEEVEALLALSPDLRVPAMKAIGVPEISAWLSGTLSADDAIGQAITATHQYAKRQRTWFRNRMGDWPRLDPLAS
ncbi:tRNA (adenosine(37)-N6)-dimethylallyltransferase MiaA [Devosia rhodophyticola]|uniref:tRNA dimethylallyltransferase n=1 Tax=Devosia rhodophyticola TaxID=3026423 RepID=A0ABY7YVH7_9HYPH|nr:tRNA (adenosine(37)-N6)-dimethylallyltransferase MiaA [Devosia rhodophyticola]WDR05363.1 tRNA (adenosine(37)-N6)-dimethylallyltransferase MiaA [Devosia rhodophyticola]